MTLGDKLALAGFTAEELRELSISFLLGAAVGELMTLGHSDEEIRERFEDCMRAGRAAAPRGSA